MLVKKISETYAHAQLSGTKSIDIWSKIDLQIDHVLDFWGENRSLTRYFAHVIDLSSVCDASTKLRGLRMHTTLIDLDGLSSRPRVNAPFFPRVTRLSQS